MTDDRPYVASCAGCGERRSFATIADLAAWTSVHRCWEEGDE